MRNLVALHGGTVSAHSDGLGRGSTFTVVLAGGLPVIDGYELATRLHALPETADCRLIALTGYGQEHDGRRSLDAGFHEHLVKPIDVDRLVRLVEAVRAARPSPPPDG